MRTFMLNAREKMFLYFRHESLVFIVLYGGSVCLVFIQNEYLTKVMEQDRFPLKSSVSHSCY